MRFLCKMLIQVRWALGKTCYIRTKNYRIAIPIASAATSRERDIVRKGIERLERQIFQLIGATISKDQENIALLKKCNTVDAPAVNSAI